MITPTEYKARDPKGKAILKPAEFHPPHECPDEDYPLWLSTGRLVYHFHTRTKTGRSQDLQEAAPDCFVQMNGTDAAEQGLSDRDRVRVESRRGMLEARVRIGDIETGCVFIPFHYGYWDDPERMRAANELTLFEWDAVSKQPHFKYAAVKIEKIAAPARRDPEEAPGTLSELADRAKHLARAAGADSAVVSSLRAIYE